MMQSRNAIMAAGSRILCYAAALTTATTTVAAAAATATNAAATIAAATATGTTVAQTFFRAAAVLGLAIALQEICCMCESIWLNILYFKIKSLKLNTYRSKYI